MLYNTEYSVSTPWAVSAERVHINIVRDIFFFLSNTQTDTSGSPREGCCAQQVLQAGENFIATVDSLSVGFRVVMVTDDGVVPVSPEEHGRPVAEVLEGHFLIREVLPGQLLAPGTPRPDILQLQSQSHLTVTVTVTSYSHILQLQSLVCV